MIETAGISAMRSALWAYGLSSHLIHADETAIRVIKDRLERPEPERMKMILAHAARLLSDEIAYFMVVAAAITYALGQPRTELQAVNLQIEPFFRELNELNRSFYDHIDGAAFSQADTD